MRIFVALNERSISQSSSALGFYSFFKPLKYEPATSVRIVGAAVWLLSPVCVVRLDAYSGLEKGKTCCFLFLFRAQPLQPLPAEILCQTIMFLSRDDLDTLELTCRQLHTLVRSDVFVKWGALRRLRGFTLRANFEVTIRREGKELQV